MDINMAHEALVALGDRKPVKIAIIGDLMVDEYIYGEVNRISPEAPIPILLETRRELRAGGAANAALAICALGAKVHVIGVHGNDLEGHWLADYLGDYTAITTDLFITRKPTIRKTRYIGIAGHRHEHQVFRVDREDTSKSGEARVKITEAVNALSGIGIIAIQDYNKGLLSKQLTQDIIRSSIPVVVDPAHIDDYSKYHGASMITPNRFEASTATGIPIESRMRVSEIGRIIEDNNNIPVSLITLDKDGCYLYNNGHGMWVGTQPRNVYDVTGAGDEVLAMAAYGMAQKWDARIIATLANVVGGLEVEVQGTKPIGMQEVIEELDSILS